MKGTPVKKTTAAVALGLVLALTGCGSDDAKTPAAAVLSASR